MGQGARKNGPNAEGRLLGRELSRGLDVFIGVRRRWFLAGATALGCTGTKPSDLERKRDTANPVAGKFRVSIRSPLVAIAQWTSMMARSSVAVYMDGLVDYRWTEFVEDEKFGRYVDHFRVGLAEPSEMPALHKSLASPTFLSAKRDYHEDGVHDGGAVTISEPMSGRRIIVVNDPADLPQSVGSVVKDLRGIAMRVKAGGADPFTKIPGRGRMLLVHEFLSPEQRSFVFTVFESGRLELRLTADPNDPADEATDFPTPRSVALEAEDATLEPLRQAVAALEGTSLVDADLRGKRGSTERLRIGGPRPEIEVPVGFAVPKVLQRVIDESHAVADLIRFG